MTKDDFIQWRSNPVTQEAFGAIATAAEQVAADIINSTEFNLEAIQYKKGFIKGIQEIMGWAPMFDREMMEPEEENTEDEI